MESSTHSRADHYDLLPEDRAKRSKVWLNKLFDADFIGLKDVSFYLYSASLKFLAFAYFSYINVLYVVGVRCIP